jgi:hypothetical protein
MPTFRERLQIADEGADALRKLAGLLLALGLILVFIRRSSFEDPWGDFALLLVLLLTFLFLYGTAWVAGPPAAAAAPGEAPPAPAGAPGPVRPALEEELGWSSWQAVYGVFGLLVLPLLLFQFLEWIDGDTAAPLNTAWIFLVTAAAAAAAAFFLRTRYTLLLAGLSLIVAWLALWQELLTDGLAADTGTLRGLLVLIALILLGAAVLVYLREPGRLGVRRGVELVTAAGVAGVAAGGLSITTFAQVQGELGVEAGFVAEPSFFWDLVLLAASLLLILFGARFAARGPVYVGAFGLLIFALVVGLEVGELAEAIGGLDLGGLPEGSIVGWPLALLLIGAALFVLSVLPGVRLGSLGVDRLERGELPERRRREGPPPPAPPPPAGGPTPPAGSPPGGTSPGP